MDVVVTEPVLGGNVSKTVFVLGPVKREVDRSILSTLEDLQREWEGGIGGGGERKKKRDREREREKEREKKRNRER